MLTCLPRHQGASSGRLSASRIRNAIVIVRSPCRNVRCGHSRASARSIGSGCCMTANYLITDNSVDLSRAPLYKTDSSVLARGSDFIVEFCSDLAAEARARQPYCRCPLGCAWISVEDDHGFFGAIYQPANLSACRIVSRTHQNLLRTIQTSWKCLGKSEDGSCLNRRTPTGTHPPPRPSASQPAEKESCRAAEDNLASGPSESRQPFGNNVVIPMSNICRNITQSVLCHPEISAIGDTFVASSPKNLRHLLGAK